MEKKWISYSFFPESKYGEKNFDFKIAQFNESKRNEAKKIFEDLRTGDPITDKNLIIRQYFEANKSFYEDYSKLRRVYDAVKTLGMRDGKIEEIFGARNEMPLYQNIEDNQFFPLLISKRAALQFAQLNHFGKLLYVVI